MTDSAENYHLVHANVALGREKFDHPVMAGFFEQVDAVNHIAYQSPGFIAEIQPIDRNDVYPEPWLLNISLWESVGQVKDFVYTGLHLEALKNRQQWFQSVPGPNYVLFWLPATEQPTAKEVAHKLRLLEMLGPSDEAFTFSCLSDFKTPKG